MSAETFLALIALALATLFTPGPNNAMLAASGANFGFRRSVPHLLGVAIGFPVMMMIVGLVLGGLFQSSPAFRETLRWGGALILVWIAYKLATSGSIGSVSGPPRPFSFVQAVGFQWINPKAWAMAVAATSQFVTAANPYLTVAIVAATFVSLGLCSASGWTAAGQAMTRWLTTDQRLRWFNLAMAALILLSTLQLLLH